MHPATIPPTERTPTDRLSDGWQRSAVLIVDDEEGMRNFLSKTLEKRCGQVMVAGSAEEADELARAHRFDLVILDITLPGKNGISWLRELRDQGFSGEVVLITAFADLETAIEALRAGASGLHPQAVSGVADPQCGEAQPGARAPQARELGAAAHAAPAHAADRRADRRLGAIRRLRAALARAAGVASTVLLTGESGTGKELAALALHSDSPRARAPFVPVACATMSPERIETELFGHAKGAFAGATKAATACSTTRKAARCSSTRWPSCRCRCRPRCCACSTTGASARWAASSRSRSTCASSRPPTARCADEVAAGRFRKDLYYRLQVVEITLAAAARAQGRHPELVAHFIADAWRRSSASSRST